MAVYFIRAGEDGPVKIGYAADVSKRLIKMQADNAAPLTVIRQIQGGRPTEAAMHTLFAEQHIRGEWFRFHASMLSVGEAIEDPVPVIPDDPTKRAIMLAGGTKSLAITLGIRSPAVSQWERVPAERVGKVSAITGIPPHELRPDLFPKEAAQ
jgi:hypothetical protein